MPTPSEHQPSIALSPAQAVRLQQVAEMAGIKARLRAENPWQHPGSIAAALQMATRVFDAELAAELSAAAGNGHSLALTAAMAREDFNPLELRGEVAHEWAEAFPAAAQAHREAAEAQALHQMEEAAAATAQRNAAHQQALGSPAERQRLLEGRNWAAREMAAQSGILSGGF